MSSDGTPGYPAPLTACIVATKIFLIPKRWCKGPSAKTRPIAEQFRFMVTNPNCSAIGLVLALGPFHQRFGIKKIFVATMQAVSGAGYPGVPSLDIVGNV